MYRFIYFLQIASGDVWQIEGLLAVAQQMSTNLTVVVYSLDLPSSEFEQVRFIQYRHNKARFCQAGL